MFIGTVLCSAAALHDAAGVAVSAVPVELSFGGVDLPSAWFSITLRPEGSGIQQRLFPGLTNGIAAGLRSVTLRRASLAQGSTALRSGGLGRLWHPRTTTTRETASGYGLTAPLSQSLTSVVLVAVSRQLSALSYGENLETIVVAVVAVAVTFPCFP